MVSRFLRLLALFLAAAYPLVHAQENTAARVRVVQSFDADWLFTRDDAPSSEDPMYDDTNWRAVSVPHDWGIEGQVSHDAPSGRGGGYRPTGISWYRKRFSLPSDLAGRRLFVEFDGVMGHSEIWINGQRIGGRPSGFAPIECELTGRVKFGEDDTNVLAVRTDTSAQPASRWYAGQGIYRHVRLVATAPIRIAPFGLVVTTPEVGRERALVRVRTTVENEDKQARRVTLHVTLLDPSGGTAGEVDLPSRQLGIGESARFEGDIAITSPQLWDLGEGRLYRAVARLDVDGETADDVSAAFGIRDARFQAATGFWLNGRNVRLKGVALHQDGGAVGDAVPLAVWERRLSRLRSLGVNAIRTAHNPPSTDFLDLCDRMGLLVMDEFFDAWTVAKPSAEQGTNTSFTEWGRRDARDFVRRDRNHPSIVLYSVGNEIHDTTKPVLARHILAGLVGIVHEEDPTRPVTQALFRPGTTHDFANGLADMLDVIGTNYRDRELLAAQRAKPTRIIVGTEERHDASTWLEMRDHPSLAGQFLWTGVDYLGEADWPLLTSTSGLLDRTGRIMPRGYQRQSWWSDAPMVRIARVEPSLASSDPRQRPGYDRSCDWTPRNPAPGADTTVEVYSNCSQVELFLNGRSLGTQALPADASPRTWQVPFEPGTLRAVASSGGHEVAADELRTAGSPARIELSTDQTALAPHWDEVAFVTVRAVDAQGVPCPWADTSVKFKVTGPAALVAADNGDPRDPTPFASAERKLFRGECVAIVRATAGSGRITVTASAPGLPETSVQLDARR